VATPAAVTVLREATDVLLVATKATGLEAALDRVAAPCGLIVPLLNGFDHMALLRERFTGGAVAAGVIRIEADRPRAGQIVHSSPFLRVDLAADDRTLGPALEALARTLRDAGVPALIGPSEAQILWSKLVRLVALACTTSAFDQPIGAIRSEPRSRATLVAAIEEAAAVANADGATIDPAATLGELEDAHPELGSSMRRDIAAGREPELDAIAGAVLRAGERHGLACPTIAQLATRVAARAGIPAPAVRT
jgi:2-dehydropantoate 2-reductase